MTTNSRLTYLIQNSESICLDSTCGDTTRLIPSKQCNKLLLQGEMKSIFNASCFIQHKHTDKFGKISDILERKFENIKCISSHLKKLQDSTSILIIIQDSVQQRSQNIAINQLEKGTSDFCIQEAQKISKEFNSMNEHYLLEEIRDFVILYRDNQISFKQFSDSVSNLIEDYNIIENQIYFPIFEKMNKGVVFNESSKSKLTDDIKIFADNLIQMKLELLSKLILNHLTQIEQLTYYSYNYLKVIIRIFKKFLINLDNQYDKQENDILKNLNKKLIIQLVKYGEYFQKECDIQNQVACYSQCIELCPQFIDAYYALIRVYNKLQDKTQTLLINQLSLLQFPKKTVFLSGILSELNILDSDQVNIIKIYQNNLNKLNQSNELILLEQIFKLGKIDLNTGNLLQQYNESSDRHAYFHKFHMQVLRRNDNSQNLIPKQQFKDFQIRINPHIKTFSYIKTEKDIMVQDSQNTKQIKLKKQNLQNIKTIKQQQQIKKSPINKKILKNQESILISSSEDLDDQFTFEEYQVKNKFSNKVSQKIKKSKLKKTNNSNNINSKYTQLRKEKQTSIESEQDLSSDQSTNYSSTSKQNSSSRSSSSFIEILSSQDDFEDSQLNINKTQCISIDI